MVLVKKSAAEAARKADNAQATAGMMAAWEENVRQQSELDRVKRREALSRRAQRDAETAEDERLKAEAKAKQRQVDRERTAREGSSSVMVKQMKDKMDGEDARARHAAWVERQKAHAAEVAAEVAHHRDEQMGFINRPHGHHVVSPLGEAF
jgi:hypothetical protein